MGREVARELLGLPSEEVAAGPKAAQAWQACAAYFADRTQSTNQQCPGRAADMSMEAAAAFIAAVKTVASKADGGNKQPLLPWSCRSGILQTEAGCCNRFVMFVVT